MFAQVTRSCSEWLISRMNGHVTLQEVFGAKSCLTHITNVSFIWLSARVTVHVNVILQVFYACKTLSTFIASKQPSSVRLFMPYQAALVTHCVVTVFTLVWLLPLLNVNEHVIL